MTRVHASSTPALRPPVATEPPPPPPQRPAAAPGRQPGPAHRVLVERALGGGGGPAAADQRSAAARKALAPYAALQTTVSREAVALSLADPRHAHLSPQAAGALASATFVRQVLAADPGLADACLAIRMRGGSTEVDRAIARLAGAGLTGLARYVAGEQALTKLRQFGPESRQRILDTMSRGATLAAAVSAEGTRLLERQQARAREAGQAGAATRSVQLGRLAESQRVRESCVERAARAMALLPDVSRLDQAVIGAVNAAELLPALAWDLGAPLIKSPEQVRQAVARAVTVGERAGGHLLGDLPDRIAEATGRYGACLATARRLEAAEADLGRAITEGRSGSITTGLATVTRLRGELSTQVAALEQRAGEIARRAAALDGDRGHALASVAVKVGGTALAAGAGAAGALARRAGAGHALREAIDEAGHLAHHAYEGAEVYLGRKLAAATGEH